MDTDYTKSDINVIFIFISYFLFFAVKLVNIILNIDVLLDLYFPLAITLTTRIEHYSKRRLLL